jgi:AcrR family transcriptional regulator
MANFTQMAIIQTFQDMLEEMPFDKITVSAVVARCQISSNTFYYHFRDIYDLLDAWLSEQKKAILQDKEPGEEWDGTLRRILHKMQDHPRIVYHAFDSLTRDRLERYIFSSEEDAFYRFAKKQTAGAPVPDETVRAVSSVCCYSLIGFILKFVWSRMDMDVDSSVGRLRAVFGGMFEHIPDVK